MTQAIRYVNPFVSFFLHIMQVSYVFVGVAYWWKSRLRGRVSSSGPAPLTIGSDKTRSGNANLASGARCFKRCNTGEGLALHPFKEGTASS